MPLHRSLRHQVPGLDAGLLDRRALAEHLAHQPQGHSGHLPGIAGGHGKACRAGFVEALPRETVGTQVDGQGSGTETALAQLARRPGGEGRHGFLHRGKLGQGRLEAAGGAQAATDRLLLAQALGRDTPQLLPGALPHHAQGAPHQSLRHRGHVPGGARPAERELACRGRPDAPDVLQSKPAHGLLLAFGRVEQVHAAGAFLELLGHSVGHLGQCARAANPHAHGNPHLAQDLAPHQSPPGRRVGDAVDVHEGLVDGIGLQVRGVHPQHLGHAGRQVAVQGVVAGEDGDAPPTHQVADLVERRAHGHADRLGLVALGHHAAVVVGKDHHGLSAQVGAEQALAVGVEAVAVHQGDHGARLQILCTA